MSGLVLSLFPGIGLLDTAFEEEGFCVVRGPDVLWGGDVRRFHPPPGRFEGVIGGPPCQAFSSLAHLVRANGHEPKFGNLIPEYERCVAEASPAWFLMEEVRAAPIPHVRGYAVRDFIYNNAWILGDEGMGQEQDRLRRFSFGIRGERFVDLRRWIQAAALMLPEQSATVSAGARDNSADAKVRAPACLGSPVGIRRGGEIEQQLRPERYRRKAVLSDAREVPVAVGGSGKLKASKDGAPRRFTLADALRLQGLPEDFLEHAPFTVKAKVKAVANGVPLAMGRALARAVKRATLIGEAVPA